MEYVRYFLDSQVLTGYKNRELRLKNEKRDIRREEIEVEAMLLVLSDDSDEDNDGLEYVPDSEEYLLLAPDSDSA